MERNFLLDQNQQWSWHKSWNLPNISITLDVQIYKLINDLQIKDPTTGELLLPPAEIYVSTYCFISLFQAKLFVVKNEEDQLLVDVGLKSNEEKLLVNSYAIFSGLKFKSTSYNHDGSPFQLVLSVYQGSLLKDEAPLVLISKISPILYINSRKLAKECNVKVTISSINIHIEV